MPVTASGEEKVKQIKVKQKNGDIYVKERRYVYNPAKRNIDILGERIIGKIPKGQTEMVPTREKKPNGEGIRAKRGILKVKKSHVGMMRILDFIGKSSGIDDDLYAATDIATAQKIISVARYLLATEGDTIPGLSVWQINHPIPYNYPLSEDVCHDLFNYIGLNESIPYNFFKSRTNRLSENDAIAYDSTTISAYSRNMAEAKYGYNKDGDGLKTIKLIAMYSINTRQPIAYVKRPSDIPDARSIISGLEVFKTIDLKVCEIVMDGGYFSADNMNDIMQWSYHFIVRARDDAKWAKEAIDNNRAEFTKQGNYCPFDYGTTGFTTEMSWEYIKKRKETGAQKGDEQKLEKRVYVHMFYSESQFVSDKTGFHATLERIKVQLEDGCPLSELAQTAQSLAKKYLFVRKWGNKVTVTYNEDACAEANKYHGFLVLLADKEKDTFECLRKYRNREHIEAFFEQYKDKGDGGKPRVWSEEVLNGRLFVQFVELCYWEYYRNLIQALKKKLDSELLSDSVSKGQKDNDKALKNWLDATPLIDQLKWFDAVDETDMNSPVYRGRWTSEMVARDQFFLESIGMPKP